MSGVELQDHVPFIERALQLAPIHGDAGQEIVCVGVMRMPLQPAHGNLEGKVDLTLAAQRLA